MDQRKVNLEVICNLESKLNDNLSFVDITHL